MRTDSLAGYLFHQGTNSHAYEYLGVSSSCENDVFSYTFRTWAPNADGVSLIGDFNGWKPDEMQRNECGDFEITKSFDHPLDGSAYKFRIRRGIRTFDKGDPYARFSRGGSDGASVIVSSDYAFSDDDWMKARKSAIFGDNGCFCPSPINIYEVHAGSFVRHSDGSYLSYRELCDVLLPYVKSMGFTHVEFLPLAEYPFDPSWGYQVAAFYAPTSRFGKPDDLRYLIDKFHQNGVGVILDFVPAHFVKDSWGLYEFDGSPLYEYQGKDRQESRSWGTRFFDVGREEVESFLVSNALYYFREFHVDGLRVDAVASMLYLDYDRDPGEWIPNDEGTNINKEAVAFFQKMNTAIFSEYPDALMIAEESANFMKVTHPVSEGGLGFNFKWNMGFANDIYDYIATDPLYRKEKHKALNFPLMYAFTENYVLPISHDEVVHGKKALIDKPFGSYEDKFATVRALMLLSMTYPGKKLFFMGCEYGQFREWDFADSLEWFMLDYPAHRTLRQFSASLFRFYLDRPELYELDFSQNGFRWLLPDENEKNLVAFERFDRSGNSLTVIISFSGSPQTVTVSSPKEGLEPVFVTTECGVLPKDAILQKKDRKGKRFCTVTIPPLCGVVLRKKILYPIIIKENENVL